MNVLERSIYPLLKQISKLGNGTTSNFSLGRSEDNDMIMHDPTISKQQAQITIIRGNAPNSFSYKLRDMAATNPISINGKPVGSFEINSLNLGDEIKLGRFFLVFTSPVEFRKKLLAPISG